MAEQQQEQKKKKEMTFAQQLAAVIKDNKIAPQNKEKAMLYELHRNKAQLKKLRSKGYTDQQIADILNKTGRTITAEAVEKILGKEK